MRRIGLLLLIIAVFFAFASSGLAMESLPYSVSSNSINLSREGTGSFTIHVGTEGTAYAGLQFELVTDSEVAIKPVTFSQGAGGDVIDPMISHGSVYFSLYSKENTFKDIMSCTVEVKYTGTTKKDIVIKEIKQVKVLGEGIVDSLVSSEAKTISLNPYSSGVGKPKGGGKEDNSTTEEDSADIPETPGPVTGVKYKDLNMNHWAYEYIRIAVEKGIINGMPDGTFLPDKNVTRAEFMKMVAIAFGLESEGRKEFGDIKDHWAKEYIGIAASLDIVKGLEEDRFGPNEYISRQDMAVIIQRICTHLQKTLPETNQSSLFGDESRIKDYAKEAVKALQRADIIARKDNNMFDPDGYATRAESVKIIIKALETILSQGTIGLVP